MRNPYWRPGHWLGPLRRSNALSRPGTALLAATFTLGLTGGMLVAVSAAPGSPLQQLMASQPAPVNAPVPINTPVVGTAADGPAGSVDLGDGTYTAPYDVVDGVKVFHLDMVPTRWEISPGVVKQAWTFNGTVPGPTIRINEGDRVRFIVKNDLPEETGVHWHGMELPNDQDGVPHLTQHPIQPGETYTYEWTALATGTHWYHSHMGGNQVGMGLYGALEVIPKRGDIPADRDYTVIVNDGVMGFILNGKSFPATRPLPAKVGERVHIRLIGSGPEMIHMMHLHGGHFDLVAQDGMRLPAPVPMDTVATGVGQTYDLIFVPPFPGKWLLHCHIFSHSETPAGMQGMVTYLDVAPADGASGDTGGLPGLPGLPGQPGLPIPAQPGLPVGPSTPAQPGSPAGSGASAGSGPPTGAGTPAGSDAPAGSGLPQLPELPHLPTG